jgi:hypothetical protein
MTGVGVPNHARYRVDRAVINRRTSPPWRVLVPAVTAAETAVSRLGIALLAHGVDSAPCPLGLLTSRLFVAVARLTGNYCWFDGPTAMRHPMTDPQGAAERIAALHHRTPSSRPARVG